MTDATLDPDIAALLAATPPHPPYAEMGAEAARATFRQAVTEGRAPGWQLEPVHAVEDRTVDGPGGAIPVRVYRPRHRAEALSADSESNRLRTVEGLPVVVYFHGGGWTIGDVDTHDAQARMLCNAADAVVVSVDYRLAPEHPYPAAFEDTVATVRWAAAHAGEVHGDPARLAVAGDSSGGNLAAAVCQWARDLGGPPIAAQCLVYPVTDLHAVGASWTAFDDGYNLAVADMEWFNTNYVPDAARRDDPYVSPLRAADVGGLPPAIVATASHDILRDQGEAYAARLREAGVPVVARRYHGLVHSFFRFSELSEAARAANAEICARLRALLHDQPGGSAWD